MTRDELIRLAGESGLSPIFAPQLKSLARFAELVVKHEREAHAKAIENSMSGFLANSDWANGYIQAAKDIAEGIRARGDT